MNRNCKGQFVPDNSIARKGGLARARALPAERRRAIARQGWDGAEMRTRFWGGGPAAHDDDAWIDEMARRHEERLDAIADATSAHFGHD